MRFPVIIVNFKIYEQATGLNAIELAKIHNRVAKETGASIAIAVSALDFVDVLKVSDIPVFSQHVDPVAYGNFTGKISPYHVRSLGGYGTLLNHAEFQLGDEVLRESIARAKDAGLFTVACANNGDYAGKIIKWDPDLVAVEPPRLIGGDVSVSSAEPDIIEEGVLGVGRGRLLVGAGIKNGKDVKTAISLGACGVLVSSGVVRAEDCYVSLLDLVSGIK